VIGQQNQTQTPGFINIADPLMMADHYQQQQFPNFSGNITTNYGSVGSLLPCQFPSSTSSSSSFLQQPQPSIETRDNIYGFVSTDFWHDFIYLQKIY
jgi:hypothetical protein